MIHFNCPGCGKEFSVREEFGGRATRCPTCQRALVVPAAPDTAAPDTVTEVHRPAAATAAVPPAPPTSVAPAPFKQTSGPPPGRDVASALSPPGNGAAPSGPDEDDGRPRHKGRYRIADEIARGGMGAVVRAVDNDIRREVAIKYMLDHKDARQRARFVEEAQITGQLEHPNIVPVHELGVDDKQRPFFAMKMVRGRSLGQVLEDLSAMSPTAENDWPLGRLTNVLVSVCNALSYAHARGVIHRDLKPANVMIGDFGEVYLMDWGVAKIIGAQPGTDPAPAWVNAPAQPTFSLMPEEEPTQVEPASLDSSSAFVARPVTPVSPRIVSDRRSGGAMTREGWVLGTPGYMPPEQARGQTHAIDQRSDVFALGAILYEVLTLTPPIQDVSGDPVDVLKRVIACDFPAPEERAPQRARQGKMPRELCAIAMKALAQDPAQRYQTIAFLQQDIERFQEGRSVSAKEDSIWEMAVKLVKRNKAVSLAAGLATVILLAVLSVSSVVNYQARVQADEAREHADAAKKRADEARKLAETNYDAFVKADKERREHAKKSVPAFLRAAKLALSERQFEDALAQADIAVDIEPDNPDAQLLRGQLLICLERYAAAADPLKAYERLAPGDKRIERLRNAAALVRPGDSIALLDLADIFYDQKAPLLAERMTRLAEGLTASFKEKLALYQKRINAAWPEAPTLTPDDRGGLSFGFVYYGDKSRITDLAPLKGIPITDLNLDGCKEVRSLEALRGMKLRKLNIHECNIDDLGPLRDMPLESLSIAGCTRALDLEPLAKLPLKWLDLGYVPAARNLEPLRGLKLAHLNLFYSGVSDRDLELVKTLPLESLVLSGCGGLTGIASLRGMRLKKLELASTSVADLAPLEGMPLEYLEVRGFVGDLSPLRGMKGLKTLLLSCGGAERGLEPIAGLPISRLEFWSADITGKSLEALRDLPLVHLALDNCGKVDSLAALRGLKLTHLSARQCAFSDLTPLEGMPLVSLDISACDKVTDLRPLRGMRLLELGFPAKSVKEGIEAARGMTSLRTLWSDPTRRFEPGDFWRRYDAGEFR